MNSNENKINIIQNTIKLKTEVTPEEIFINKITNKIKNVELYDNIKSNNVNEENTSQDKGKMKKSNEMITDNKINNEEKPPISSELKKNEVTVKNKPKQHDKEENIYKLKVIEERNAYQGRIQQKNIITQNINGPCPLLALCNILILRGDISIELKKTEITYEEIIDILGDYIAKTVENNNNSDECSFQDVLNIIPTLKKGLDINIKFDSVQSFEHSPALTVFKFFNIQLIHGWTVDPEDKETYQVIVNECGNYNKVVEKIIESDSVNVSKNNLNEVVSIEEKNKREKLYHKAMICKNFIESNATQLSYHGLTSIPEILSVGEPVAFFRNNHFLTLIKTPDNNMYTLVTDQGFVNEKKIVWESLSTVDGDSYFVDGLFNKYPKGSSSSSFFPSFNANINTNTNTNTNANTKTNTNTNINSNNIINNSNTNSNNTNDLNSPNEDLDYAIALSIQEDEENKRDEMIQRKRIMMMRNPFYHFFKRII